MDSRTFLRLLLGVILAAVLVTAVFSNVPVITSRPSTPPPIKRVPLLPVFVPGPLPWIVR